MSLTETLHLSTFPEELLERILFYCVVAPSSQQSRPSWHRATESSLAPGQVRGRLALLLVSKTFLRISTPLFYHTVNLVSANQLHRLLCDALRPNSFLASHIRRLVLSGIWADAGELLRLCNVNLKMLDITLDTTQLSPGVHGHIRDLDAEEFCEGLKEVTSLTHIVIRKPNNVYLTQPKPRYVLSEVAKAMYTWDDLEHADVTFRLSDDSGSVMANSALLPTTRVPQLQQGPITALTHSLSTRPKLHTLSTLLPSVWNETILRVSTNPSLQRIILGDGTGGGREQSHSRGVTWSGKDFYAAPVCATLSNGPVVEGNHGIASTGLFLLQAKKHARLTDLIRVGTSITRTRAQTMGTMGIPMSSSPTPAPPSPPPCPRSNLPNAPHYYARSQSVLPTVESSQSSRTRYQRPQVRNTKRTFQPTESLEGHASASPGPSSNRRIPAS
ncbi:hypothetical protein BDZ97DRAFT_1759534 [Flammula alnicola]|nr:hypothetical protein BDZ97DRAFT_1759534 [Flammula alnicola]